MDLVNMVRLKDRNLLVLGAMTDQRKLDKTKENAVKLIVGGCRLSAMTYQEGSLS